MDHYQKIIRKVKGLNPELAQQYLLLALKSGPFVDRIYQRASKTMEELREWPPEDIKVEIKHIAREDNSWAGRLAKLSSGKEEEKREARKKQTQEVT